MVRSGEIEGSIAAVRLALDRWDVLAAREHGERARALATGHGDLRSAALVDVLLARAALLTCSEPHRELLLPEARIRQWCDDAEVGAAVERFELELLAMFDDVRSPRPLLELGPREPTDRVASAALAGLMDLAAGRTSSVRFSASPLVGLDAGGFQHVVSAVCDADGAAALPSLEQALELAERRGLRALSWVALRLKATLCRKRGASSRAEATECRLRELFESWLVTLPTADAQSALGRTSRTSGVNEASRPSALLASTIETACKMARERDPDRLVELALDSAIALTTAERGILVLSSAQRQRVAATRYVDERAEVNGLMGLSSTITDRALQSGEVVLSNDVRSDPRFRECASVALEVTSVLCIPIHARAEIEGAIYLDRRVRGRPFDADAIAAAKAVGSMLASSLLIARTPSALETRTRELETAREELALTLATRTAERNDMSRRLANIDGVTPAGAEGLVGSSAAMSNLRRVIETVATSNAPVLIAGETGSGKEIVARAIHAASTRRDGPFVAQNCGALSETLLAAELFGSVRGAYTGAAGARPGLFVAAHKGTLLLDEVGDMPLVMQTALLRVLETGELRPVGSTEVRKVDVRIVAASHHDLLELVKQRRFRDDLRYRLEVVRVEVPPLRSHLEDLPELCEHLLGVACRQYGLPERRITPAALEALGLRRFQGNVRELRHVLVNAALSARGSSIAADDLPAERSAEALVTTAPESELHGYALRVESIRRALRATRGHRGQAAKLLGVSRSTLYRFCETHDIDLAEIESRWGLDQ